MMIIIIKLIMTTTTMMMVMMMMIIICIVVVSSALFFWFCNVFVFYLVFVLLDLYRYISSPQTHTHTYTHTHKYTHIYTRYVFKHRKYLHFFLVYFYGTARLVIIIIVMCFVLAFFSFRLLKQCWHGLFHCWYSTAILACRTYD